MFVEAGSGRALVAACLIVWVWPVRKKLVCLPWAISYLFDIMVI